MFCNVYGTCCSFDDNWLGLFLSKRDCHVFYFLCLSVFLRRTQYCGFSLDFDAGDILVSFAFIKFQVDFISVRLNVFLGSIFDFLFNGGGIFSYYQFCVDLFVVVHCDSCCCLILAVL